MLKFLLIVLVIIVNFLINISSVQAETLQERIASYPDWNSQINLPSPQQDLTYPNWFEGKWQVTSKLVEQIAPLAPKFVTPGFNSYEQYLDQNIEFQVKFLSSFPMLENNKLIPNLINKNQDEIIIADRKFNSLQITKAYFQDLEKNENKPTIKVYLNPDNSTEQITELSAQNELISTVIGRKEERTSEREFITGELTSQTFRRTFSIYLNLVETETKYQLIEPNHIVADQFTAIYLSPKDPDYFIAKNQPVALYHYLLTLKKLAN